MAVASKAKVIRDPENVEKLFVFLNSAALKPMSLPRSLTFRRSWTPNLRAIKCMYGFARSWVEANLMLSLSC